MGGWELSKLSSLAAPPPPFPRFISLLTFLLFSHLVMSDSLQLHGLQHAKFPCPLLSPRVYLNSCWLNWWCDLTISSSAAPFFCLQSFPASGSFPIRNPSPWPWIKLMPSALGTQSPSHWTTREVPKGVIKLHLTYLAVTMWVDRFLVWINRKRISCGIKK